MLGQPWDTILFLVVVPLLIQAYKLYRENGGKPLPKIVLQIISFVLAGVFVFLNGDFASSDCLKPWDLRKGRGTRYIVNKPEQPMDLGLSAVSVVTICQKMKITAMLICALLVGREYQQRGLYAQI